VENIFKEDKLIRAYDVDFKNRLKLNSVFNFLQDVASLHAEEMKLGFKDLGKHNLAWVLNWGKLEMLKYPCFGDTITIKTWPKCRHKLFSIRDFLIYNEYNEIISRVSTAWLLLNIKTKRIADLKLLPAGITYRNESALEVFPQRLQAGETKEVIFTKKITYSDIDINLHTNNTKYVEFVLDSYTKQKYEENTIKSIQISFLSESFFDDELEISRSGKISSDLIEGINKNSGKVVFQAEVEWD
jgi:acyl-ACP thioesterase